MFPFSSLKKKWICNVSWLCYVSCPSHPPGFYHNHTVRWLVSTGRCTETWQCCNKNNSHFTCHFFNMLTYIIYNFMHMVYFSKILLWKSIVLYNTFFSGVQYACCCIISTCIAAVFSLMFWSYLAVVLVWCVYIPCCWGITRGSRHRQTNQEILEVAERDHCRRLHCWQYLLQNIVWVSCIVSHHLTLKEL